MKLTPIYLALISTALFNNAVTADAFDDAFDEGFSIVSAKTGKIAVFALYNHEEDFEGDLLKWVFKCVTPGLTHLKAVIFND